ncbi:hypothetical protein EJB05_48611 [Eragrostis curvula]|uniref:Uncharacterized protein n=1 Tax=Eragrostis curvula TaxID=38414 RepID=A0A5J9T2M5_9POAL|nr:hypothetical protein EJB05_48611 [Eragrostis curvula]
MAFTPRPPTAGAPPPQPEMAAVSAAARERHPVKGSQSLPSQEEMPVAASQETRTQIPSEDYYTHFNTEEHTEKISKYQAMLAARLKAKYFSTKNLEKGDVVEEIVIQSETIQFSRSLVSCRLIFCSPFQHPTTFEALYLDVSLTSM